MGDAHLEGARCWRGAVSQRDVGEGGRAEPRQALVERAGAAGEPGACVVDGPAWAAGGGRAAAVLVCGEPGACEEATRLLPRTQGWPRFHSHKEAAAFLSLVCTPPSCSPQALDSPWLWLCYRPPWALHGQDMLTTGMAAALTHGWLCLRGCGPGHSPFIGLR